MAPLFDVLVVGELNVDLILNGLQSQPVVGKEVLARDLTLTLGSSSAIFASNLSCLGPSVSFLGRVGQDSFGSLVVDSLTAKGVDTSLLLATPDFATGATIVLNHGEDRAMVTFMGAMERLTLRDCTQERLKGARHLHFASVFLQPGIRQEVGLLFRRAKELGLTTSFDPQWDPAEAWDLDLEDLLPFVDVFLPNETELLHLTGEATVDAALATLRPHARTVVVKLGNQGSMGQDRDQVVRVPAFLNRHVVDAIGAGDSFDAGFVSRFIRGESLQACLTFGNLMGAVSTTGAGGTGAFSSLQDVLTLAKERFQYGA